MLFYYYYCCYQLMWSEEQPIAIARIDVGPTLVDFFVLFLHRRWPICEQFLSGEKSPDLLLELPPRGEIHLRNTSRHDHK